MLALPGAAYLYQGEELGLDEVVDLPEDVLQDPTWERSGHEIRGRDGCRVPIPWSGTEPPFGFGPPGSTPWLPQPAAWRTATAEAQADDPASPLELFRSALRVRRAHPGLAGEELTWLASPPGTLVFERGAGLRCAVNLSDEALPLPRERTHAPPQRRRWRGPPAAGRGRLVRRAVRLARRFAPQTFGGLVVRRTTSATSSTSRSACRGDPAISSRRRRTARAPVSMRGWWTVVRPT